MYAFGGQSQRRGDQLGQRRPGGARRAPRRTSQGPRAGGIDLVADDPEPGRASCSPRRTRRSTTAEQAQGQRREPSTPLREPRSWPRSTGCTAWSTSRSTPLFTFAGGGRRRRSTSRAIVRGPDGAPFVLDAATKSGVPDRPQAQARRRRSSARAARPAGTTEATPKLLARRRARPADGRRQERPLALAAGERRRQGHAHPGRGQRRHEWGDDVTRDRHVPPRSRGEPLQLLRRRPVGAADPALLRRPDGGGFPARADRLAADGARRQRDHLAVHRRRHLARRAAGCSSASRRGNSDGWEPTARRTTSPAHDADRVPLIAGRGERRDGHDLRLRPRRTTGSIAYRKVERRLPRPVPARRRRPRLGGHPRHVRRARASRRAPDASSGSSQTASTGRCSSRSRRIGADAVRGARRPAPSAGQPSAEPTAAPEPRRGRRDPAPRRNPTRRTPIVTSALIGACFVAFAIELGQLGDRRRRRARGLLPAVGRRPGRHHGGAGPGDDLGGRVGDCSRACSCTAAGCTCSATCCSCGSSATTSRTASGRSRSCCSTSSAAGRGGLAQVVIDPSRRSRRRRVGRDRGGARGVHRAVPRRPHPVAGLPRLLLPAPRGAGAHRPRLLVRRSSWSTASRRWAPRRRRAAWRSSPTSAASCSGPLVGLLLRVVGAGTGAGGRGRCGPWDNPAMAAAGRDGHRERPGPHALEPPRRDPQGDRGRSLPADLDRAWEASAIAMRLQGLTAERPLTHDLFAGALEASACAVDAGRDLRARRRDVPRPAAPRARRRSVEVDSRPSDALALAVRAGAPIFAAKAVLAQAALGAGRRRSTATRTARGRRPLESTGERDRRPAPRHVPRLHELARGRPRAGGRIGRPASSAGASSGSRGRSPRIGVPRRSARPRFAQSRRRRRQKSRTARKTTWGLAPVGLPAVRG